MKIDLANLPDEGQMFEGEIAPDIYDLAEDDARLDTIVTLDRSNAACA